MDLRRGKTSCESQENGRLSDPAAFNRLNNPCSLERPLADVHCPLSDAESIAGQECVKNAVWRRYSDFQTDRAFEPASFYVRMRLRS